LHPERGALFDVQLIARHDRQQVRRGVAARMADPIIELRPEIRKQGHGTNQDAVVPEDATHFAEDAPVILACSMTSWAQTRSNSPREMAAPRLRLVPIAPRIQLLDHRWRCR
jgi:hypothetical protein